MDRVLIAIDQIQFANHLEMTLRKVGFDVETITTEFNLSEKLLTFNPDMVISRGQSAKLSAFNIGKKLKDNVKYMGKVVLIFGQDQKISPEDLTKIKTDLLLFEPMGVLKLTLSILNIDPERKELMQDRLLRMAETDSMFRSQEQAYLSSYSQDLDQEITHVQSHLNEPDKDLLINEDILKNFSGGENKSAEKKTQPEIWGPPVVSEITKEALQTELLSLSAELPLRIDNYNHQIKKIDGDLKKNLNKRKTKTLLKKQRAELMIDPGQKKLDSLDQEKQKFAQALFRKK